MYGQNRYSKSIGHFPIEDGTIYGHIIWFKKKYKESAALLEKLIDNKPVFGMIGASPQMPDDYKLLKIKDKGQQITPKQEKELPKLRASRTNEILTAKLSSFYDKYLKDANVHCIDLIEITILPNGTKKKSIDGSEIVMFRLYLKDYKIIDDYYSSNTVWYFRDAVWKYYSSKVDVNTQKVFSVRGIGEELQQVKNVVSSEKETPYQEKNVVQETNPKPKNARDKFLNAMCVVFPLPIYKELALHLNTVDYVKFTVEDYKNCITLSLIEPFFVMVVQKLHELQEEINRNFGETKVTVSLNNLSQAKKVETVSNEFAEIPKTPKIPIDISSLGIGKNPNSSSHNFKVPTSSTEVQDTFASLTTVKEVEAYGSFLQHERKCHGVIGASSVIRLVSECIDKLNKK